MTTTRTNRTNQSSYWGSTRDVYTEDVLLSRWDTTWDLLYWGDWIDPILVIEWVTPTRWQRTQPTTSWTDRPSI